MLFWVKYYCTNIEVKIAEYIKKIYTYTSLHCFEYHDILTGV